MEGLREKLKAKEEEMAILKAQAIKEQKELAIDVVRLALPVDSMFSKDLVSIDIIPRDALFVIWLKDARIRACSNRLEVHIGTLPEFTIETTLLWEFVDYDKSPATCDFLGITRDETFGASIVKIARFWGELEAALAIYNFNISCIPDYQRYSPDRFAQEFSKLKTRR